MREFNAITTEGDYSITFETDDREAYKQVQNLCRLLVDGKDGEAIPVEWIKRWANRNCMYCYDYDYPTEKHDSWYAIRDMIEDWGKENGNQNL